jgi:hypothetical protein
LEPHNKCYKTSNIKPKEGGGDFRERYAELSEVHFYHSSSIHFQKGFDEVVDSMDILQSGRRRKPRLSLGCVLEIGALSFIVIVSLSI